MRRCANKDARSRGRVDWGGVPHRSASKDAGPERRVDCEIPHWLGRRTKHFFIRVWKSFPNRRVLKTLRGSRKGKVQRGQYLSAVGLNCYKG